MIQQTPAGRFNDDKQVWLSMLIAAMQDAWRPDIRAQPCARATMAGLRAQLALPTPHLPQGLSRYN